MLETGCWMQNQAQGQSTGEKAEGIECGSGNLEGGNLRQWAWGIEQRAAAIG